MVCGNNGARKRLADSNGIAAIDLGLENKAWGRRDKFLQMPVGFVSAHFSVSI